MARACILTALMAGGLLAAAMPTGAAEGQDGLARRADESRRVAMEFMRTLKGELVRAMKAGGPAKAIPICRERAPEIARDFSERTGWRVGRTSLRLRNPANAPDPWERAVLERFEARRRAGTPVSQLEHYEVVEQDGRRVFRWMKAIPTGSPCLTCHGERIAPDVAGLLDRLYPGDRARGFKVGDIRGAFTIVQPLEE